MQNNLSPGWYTLSSCAAAGISYFVFRHWPLNPQWFVLPMIMLAVLYGVANLYRQYRGASIFRVQLPIEPSLLFKKALARYLIWLGLIYLGSHLYWALPFYSEPYFAPLRWFLDALLPAYLVGGLPYFMLTLVFKSSRSEDFYDPAVRILHVFKQTALRMARGGPWRSMWRVIGKRYHRKIALTFIMRAYFIPILLVQMYYNLNAALQWSRYDFQWANFLPIMFWIAALLWLVDTVNASLSYCFESRWIENRTRSIDLTITGWAVCLFCYPPLNRITETAFAFAPSIANNDPTALIIPSIEVLYALKLMEIGLLGLHIYVDSSLGPSVANITFKKLQTRGAYGLIRHPGTSTKLLLWFVMACGYVEFWTAKFLFGFLAWGTIYILRALTEERHLSQHAEYREYRKRVRYRFIPGVI